MTTRPLLPYGRQTIEEDDIAAVVATLRSDHLTTGPAVDRFEQALAEAVGAAGAVAVSSGTAALHAACAAVGLGEGDEVIVPAITFLATANCVRFVNAEPVFADVDPDTGLMPASEVARLIGPHTRAVIPVHLNGNPIDRTGIARHVAASGIALIEDAAHALGAEDAAGRIGGCAAPASMAAFSFHPVKHIATGEGGAVTSNDPELLRRVRLFRNHGIERDPARWRHPAPGPWWYEQHELGHNLRLSDIQAALGASQLAKLDRFIAKRRALAAQYDALLAGRPELTPVRQAPGSAYHLYPVLIEFEALRLDRADVMRSLLAQGIGSQVHYIPLPSQPYFRDRGWRVDDFPGARRYYERTLSLPLFPAMGEDDVRRVVGSLEKALGLA